MLELREGSCLPNVLVGVNVGLAFVDAIIAALAFYQLIRFHSRNSQVGWTRQKVFHLLIGSSNMGCLIYLVLTLFAACKRWKCWSNSCGFSLMALPKILFFAAFLLLLSFWVDLCHQADDEDEEDEGSFQETLLEKTFSKTNSLDTDRPRRCFPRIVHVGSRQKIVILVTLLVFTIMIACAVVIWIGMGKNPIDSAVVARVYVDLFAVVTLLLGGALACYGLLLCLRMRQVRSERASSEMWKVAGLAVVSVLCFASSALVALLTDIPVLYHCYQQPVNGVYTAFLLILYYFVGSSIPSAYVLWVMRELPPSIPANTRQRQEEPTTLTFLSDDSNAFDPNALPHPHGWTAAMSLGNQVQVSRASPI
ncbi:tobamovirus multiplication protein 1-like [Argentina anserina]|uniref:tobamovirus multiplication protein 1-like n=1 Tax=Argentina anserina TaxID=57926 RepID=UPI0021765B51|nr:tobamovirus multiplication protein 1-like [Potentilla anserina]